LPTAKLKQSIISSFKPQKRAYVVRDIFLKGFGIKVIPSGQRTYFLDCQRKGVKIKQLIGDCNDLSLFEARMKVKNLLFSINQDAINQKLEENKVSIPFKIFSQQVFENYKRNWKSSTYEVNMSYLRCQILPFFATKSMTDIDQQDVSQWFSALKNKPSAANRSLPILSIILQQAELKNIRPVGTNPCYGIKRYKINSNKTFLTSEEVKIFFNSLDKFEGEYPNEIKALKLILFTGCRKNEILSSEWNWVRDNQLFLPDSKSGPRTVWLSKQALALLSSMPKISKFIFPGYDNQEHNRRLDYFWSKFRKETEFSELRIHDLRHTYASLASLSGENILIVGKLLGHNNINTTLIYTHSPENEAQKAVEEISMGFDDKC